MLSFGYNGCMSVPYDYYPAVLYAIDLISQGYTKTAACDKSNISIPTFESYINRDEQLSVMLDEAEQRGADAMADALVQIGSHTVYGETNPQMAKVISDNIKWLLDKRHRKKYGDKIEIQHNITADKAIVDALIAGRNRAAQAQVSYQEADFIDVEPIAISDDELLTQLLS